MRYGRTQSRQPATKLQAESQEPKKPMSKPTTRIGMALIRSRVTNDILRHGRGLKRRTRTPIERRLKAKRHYRAFWQHIQLALLFGAFAFVGVKVALAKAQVFGR